MGRARERPITEANHVASKPRSVIKPHTLSSPSYAGYCSVCGIPAVGGRRFGRGGAQPNPYSPWRSGQLETRNPADIYSSTAAFQNSKPHTRLQIRVKYQSLVACLWFIRHLACSIMTGSISPSAGRSVMEM